MQQDRGVVHEAGLARVTAGVRAHNVKYCERAHGGALRDVLRGRGLDSVTPTPPQSHPLAVVLPLDVVGRLQALRDHALHVHGG